MKHLFFTFFVAFPLLAFSQKKPAEDSILIRGPYLQVATPKSMTIRWRTSIPSKSTVMYGTELTRLNKKVKSGKSVNEHIVEIKGLQPHTKYYYSIGDGKSVLQGDSLNYFYTLPTVGQEGVYRVGIFGDCGTNTVKQTTARDQFIKYLGADYLDSWILLGDNAYPDGMDAQYQTNFFNIYKDNLLKKYPLFPAPGNHDYRELSMQNPPKPSTQNVAYFRNFSMPVKGQSGGVASGNQGFYSFDIGNAHFLSLDSYGDYEGSRIYDTLSSQVQWVKKDLEANKNKGWVIAYWHHPPYTMGTHDSDKETELVKIRENFIQILERYGVDLIVCGHSHVYERSKLMKGHYGPEADFGSQFNLSQSSGLYNGTEESCPYIKSSVVNQGTVYVVTGSAGKLGPPKVSFPHAAMTVSDISVTGASMLEIRGNRIDFKWIRSDGKIGDHFTMMKDVNKTTALTVKKGESVTLTASFNGEYLWSASGQKTKTITVSPVSGKNIYTVNDVQKCIQDTFEVTVKD